MYEVFWNWFVAMMDGVVGLKTWIAKYIAYKLNERVSADKVYIRF